MPCVAERLEAVTESLGLTGSAKLSGLSVPVPGVADLLSPWRSTALRGITPHHVTLLFPWVDPPIADAAMETLVNVVGTWEPFDAELVGVPALNSGVVVLSPEPAERFSISPAN